MEGGHAFGFEYEFGDADRAALLGEARRTIGALRSELGDAGVAPRAGVPPAPRAPGAPDAGEQAALDLLDSFDRAVAEFGGYPDVVRLEERHFTEHGLTVPARFRELRRTHRFYWLRFPTVLRPRPGTVYDRLQCGVHFNPDVREGHLLPRAAMILPDRRFQEILAADLGGEVRIGESFEFEASTGRLERQAGPASAAGAASVDAKAAAGLGLVAGPFRYSVKRALVDHTAPGAAKVLWTLAGTEFLQTDDLAPIVVLQVPDGVDRVTVAGALRAYHRFDPAADVGQAFRYFTERLRAFLRAGAPTAAPPVVWDITPSL